MISFPNKIVFPYFIFFDDYETGNPLGAKSGINSLCSILVSFPAFPPHFALSLQNIFSIGSCKSSYKKYGIDVVMNPIIDDLIFLEENGIELNLPTGPTTVYFILGLILGDNKGLNEIMGITTSFIQDGCCRICNGSISDIRTCYKETAFELRNIDTYEEALIIEGTHVDGIRDKCAFNKIPSFHIVNCPSVDIMHDVFEGACYFEMCEIILYYIKEKVFTLDDLNNRKSLFDYGFYEISNQTVDISITHLKNYKLKMSASQVVCFVTHFSLMVGDLISCNDTVWIFYVNLLKIVNLLLQNSITKAETKILGQLIEKNHHMYQNVFSNESTEKKNLKPKQHNMIHYEKLISKIGPLKKLWNMKNEMYHREYKKYTNVTFNRQNLPVSIIKKECFKISNRLYNKQGFDLNYYTKILIEERLKFKHIKYCQQFTDLLNVNRSNSVILLKEVYFKLILFKNNAIIYVDDKNKGMEIYKVIYIFQIDGNIYKLGVVKLQIIDFDEHFHCYFVKENECNFKVFEFNELAFFPECLHFLPNGQIAARAPYSF